MCLTSDGIEGIMDTCQRNHYQAKTIHTSKHNSSQIRQEDMSYRGVGYMHASRSIQMNYCLLFSILCFYFTHSIILIHFYESPFSLYFLLFYFPLFAHLFATRHFTFASASRLRVRTDILVGADTLATRRAFASAQH